MQASVTSVGNNSEMSKFESPDSSIPKFEIFLYIRISDSKLVILGLKVPIFLNPSLVFKNNCCFIFFNYFVEKPLFQY